MVEVGKRYQFKSTQKDPGAPGWPEHSGKAVIVIREIVPPERDEETGEMFEVETADWRKIRISVFAEELHELGIEPKYNEHKEYLGDLITCACEGGINYWAGFDYYRWQSVERDGNLALSERPDRLYEDGSSKSTASVYDKEDMWMAEQDGDDTAEIPRYVIDREVVKLGIRRMFEAGEFSLEYNEETGYRQGRKALYDSIVTNGNEGDYDAADADMIVQWGLFGKVVYG